MLLLYQIYTIVHKYIYSIIHLTIVLNETWSCGKKKLLYSYFLAISFFYFIALHSFPGHVIPGAKKRNLQGWSKKKSCGISKNLHYFVWNSLENVQYRRNKKMNGRLFFLDFQSL